MDKKHYIVIPILLASLLAACGGGGSGSTNTSTNTGDGSSSVGSSGGHSGGGSGGTGGTGGGTASAPVGTTWASVKIGGGGYVPGIVFHPSSPHVVYARTDVGGAYRWDQATATWTPITDGFGPAEGFYHGAESIALDPDDDQRVYMSTGMYDSATGSGRLYISTDRGDHWQHVDLPFSVGSNNNGRAIGERMVVDPNLPTTLFYGSRTAGLWKSVDRGASWTQVQSLSAVRMTADQINAEAGSAMGVELVVFDTSTQGTGTATQTVYTAIAPDYATAAGLAFNLYKSTDGGATWTGVPTPITGDHIPHMVRAADGMFYVVFTHGAGPGADGPAALYKFDGTHWTLLKQSDPPTQWTNFGMGGVSVSGTGATTRIALGVTNSWGNWSGQPVVQLSDDDGATWREIESTMPHTPADGAFSGWVDDVEIDPSDRDHILHVYGGGIWETHDASSATPSWTRAVAGIEETVALSIATPPPGASYLLLNSSGDVGMHVHTDLAASPTMGPSGAVGFGNGNSADMAWSDPNYIAAIGTTTSNSTVAGVYSGDGGKTWAAFPTNPAGALANQGSESNIVVTQRNDAVWAPANSVPSYTTDNGATWVATNLPALDAVGIGRSYRLAADRKNPNKVYAYDSGGAWWGSPGKFYVSLDGGRTFTRSTDPTLSGLAANSFSVTSLAVNPNAEGDVWLADGNSVYHSTDSGSTWTRLNATKSIWGSNAWPDVYGASVLALGKAAPAAKYSAAVYMVGAVGGVWGVYRSDDAGATWQRINDDQHQYGGIGLLAADQSVYGRVFAAGGGRGVFYAQ